MDFITTICYPSTIFVHFSMLKKDRKK